MKLVKLIRFSGDLCPHVWILDFKEEAIVRQEADLQGI